MKRNIPKFAILIATIFSFSIGCSKHSDIISIYALNSNSKAFSAKFVRFIALSNQVEAVIGSVDKLIIDKNYIYVLDQMQASGVLIFSKTGQFVKKISLGRGPGELIHPQNIVLADNQLIISDQNFFKYYALNGEFLFSKSLPLGWVAYSFENFNEKNLLIQGCTDSLIKQQSSKVLKYHVINKELSKCDNSYVETTFSLIPLSETKPISSYDGKFLLLARPFNDIYQLDDRGITKKYYVDFASFNYQESDVTDGLQHVLSLFQEGKRIGMLDNIYENQALIYFTYSSFANGRLLEVPVIFSKSQHENANFFDILENANLPKLRLLEAKDNNLICLFNPGDFDGLAINKYQSDGIIPIETTSDSNPVLIIVEISLRNNSAI